MIVHRREGDEGFDFLDFLGFRHREGASCGQRTASTPSVGRRATASRTERQPVGGEIRFGATRANGSARGGRRDSIADAAAAAITLGATGAAPPSPGSPGRGRDFAHAIHRLHDRDTLVQRHERTLEQPLA